MESQVNEDGVSNSMIKYKTKSLQNGFRYHLFTNLMANTILSHNIFCYDKVTNKLYIGNLLE